MNSRRGFTLIEILVVITIVAILAVLAVSSYGVARRKAKLDIVTDTVVSILRQQQSLAKSGRSGGDLEKVSPTCYGMIFSEKEPYIQTFQAPYISVDESIDVNKSDFCDLRESSYKPQTFNELENFTVSKISVFGSEKTDYMIAFRPPEARVSAGENALEVENITQANDPRIMVTLLGQNADDTTTFTFDVTTGVAQRLLPSTQESP